MSASGRLKLASKLPASSAVDGGGTTSLSLAPMSEGSSGARTSDTSDKASVSSDKSDKVAAWTAGFSSPTNTTSTTSSSSASSSVVPASSSSHSNRVAKKDYMAKVCFLMDITGSMQPEFDTVKAKICVLIDEFGKSFKDVSVQLAFVGYRDVDAPALVVVPFTTNQDAFVDSLRGVSCSGGGDEAEDVLGGLDATLTDLDWDGAHVKLLFHIADSPHHGALFHDSMGCGDSHPHLEASPRPYNLILADYADRKIDYCFALVRSHGRGVVTTKKMANLFKDAYDKAQSARNPFMVCDLTDFSPQEFFQKFKAALSASLCSFLKTRR